MVNTKFGYLFGLSTQEVRDVKLECVANVPSIKS